MQPDDARQTTEGLTLAAFAGHGEILGGGLRSRGRLNQAFTPLTTLGHGGSGNAGQGHSAAPRVAGAASVAAGWARRAARSLSRNWVALMT